MNNINSFLLFLILIFLYINNSIAQSYYPVDPTAKCEVYIGDPVGQTALCDGLLANPNSVYVNSTTTQAQLQTQARQFRNLLEFAGSDKCKIADTFKTLCAVFFKECINYTIPNTTITYALPKLTCQSNCVNTTTLCEIPSNYINCTEEQTADGYTFPSYPTNSSLYNMTKYGGQITNYTLTCLNPYDIVSNWTGATCPFPLINHPSTDRAYDEKIGYIFVRNDSSCVAPCPSPIFEPKVWTNLFTLGDVLSFMSFFCTIFLVITYGLLNPKITRFDKLNVCIMSAAFGVALSGVIMACIGTPKVLCPDPGRTASSIDDSCLATGFILHVSALYVVSWWAIMTFEVWYAVHKVGAGKNDYFKYYCIGTSIFSWVFPISTVSARDYHSGAGNVFCWIGTSFYRNLCFWGPLGFCLIVGTIFLLMLMREIYIIVSIKINKMDKSRWEILKLEIKPICSLIMYYKILVYLFAYDQYIQQNQDRYLNTIPQYFNCLTSATVIDKSSCLVDGPPVVSIGFFVFCIRIFGVYSFLLYGLSSRTISIWRGSIVFNNSFVKLLSKKLELFTSSTKDASSSPNSSSSSSSNNPTDKKDKKQKQKDSFNLAPSQQYDSRNSYDTGTSIEMASYDTRDPNEN